MKHWHLAVLAMWLFSSLANADDLLKNCADVINDNEYRPLNEYFSNSENKFIPTDEYPFTFCQRINDQEFLFGTGEGIYYCTSKLNSPLVCEENSPLQKIIDPVVEKRFTGKNSKRFVLFSSKSYIRDFYFKGLVYSKRFYAFFLVPKSINQRGYLVADFTQAYDQSFDRRTLPSPSAENENMDNCFHMHDDDIIEPLEPRFEILNEGQSNVIIRFNQEVTACKSGRAGEKTKQTLEYTWSNFSFQKTSDHVEKVLPLR